MLSRSQGHKYFSLRSFFSEKRKGSHRASEARLTALVLNKETLEKYFKALIFFSPLLASRQEMEAPSGLRRPSLVK